VGGIFSVGWLGGQVLGRWDWIGGAALCPGAKRNLSDKLHAPSCGVAAAAAEMLRLFLRPRDLLLYFRLLFALSSSCSTFGPKPSSD